MEGGGVKTEKIGKVLLIKNNIDDSNQILRQFIESNAPVSTLLAPRGSGKSWGLLQKTLPLIKEGKEVCIVSLPCFKKYWDAYFQIEGLNKKVFITKDPRDLSGRKFEYIFFDEPDYINLFDELLSAAELMFPIQVCFIGTPKSLKFKTTLIRKDDGLFLKLKADSNILQQYLFGEGEKFAFSGLCPDEVKEFYSKDRYECEFLDEWKDI